MSQDRFEFVVEKGQVWQCWSSNQKRVLCERTVRCIEDGVVQFEGDEFPTGAELSLLMEDWWRLKVAA